MSDVVNELASDVERALTRLTLESESNRIRLYRDVLFEAHVETVFENPPNVHVPLFHHDFRAWLADFLWTAEAILLSRSQLDAVLLVLAGRSMRQPLTTITDPHILRILETVPLIAVIVEWFHQRDDTKRRHEERATKLCSTLNSFASSKGLARLAGKRFPRTANVLTRQLANDANKQILAHFRIGVELRRSNGAFIALYPLVDDSGLSQSREPSASNVQSFTPLGSVDDSPSKLVPIVGNHDHSETSSHGLTERKHT